MDIKKIKMIAPVIVLSAYSCLFVLLNNIGEGKAIEIVAPFFWFCGIGIALQLAFYFVFRNGEKAAIFSFFLLIMVINFNFVINTVQELGYTGKPRYILLIWLAIYVIIFIFLRKAKEEILYYICNIISITLAGLIIVNVITAIPDLSSWISGQNIEKLELAERGKRDKAGRNVYYMIFDEYGGPANLKHYYDYDNQDFVSYLADKGFSQSKSSYNREAYDTNKIIPNLLNLNYVTSDDANKNRAWMKEPVLYRYFEDIGYKINLVNHQNFLSVGKCNNLLADQPALGADTNFTDYLYDQSIISSLWRAVMPENYYYQKYVKNLDEAIDGMKSSWKMAGENKTFTICYLQCPHAFFVYDEEGNYLPEEQKIDYFNKNLYIEQLKYLNKCIQETLDSIIKTDPEAVIILQSDHGARRAYHWGILTEENYDVEVEYMENVLNCVYWGEGVEPQDIEGLSGINTLRLVLNVEFGSDFEMISLP